MKINNNVGSLLLGLSMALSLTLLAARGADNLGPRAGLQLAQFKGNPIAQSWSPVLFLVGAWKGDGMAEGQKGNGTTTFAWDLEGRVLVRRDRSDYPASQGQPAQTYESMMVIYPDSMTKHLRADYYDDGGHVIHYTLAASDWGKVQFVSDPGPGPVFRLTYDGRKGDLAITFEMKVAGASAYQTVARGTAQKQP